MSQGLSFPETVRTQRSPYWRDFRNYSKSEGKRDFPLTNKSECPCCYLAFPPGVMHLTYANLFQIEDLLKCAIGLPASGTRANVFTSRNLISASSPFNDQSSSPILLSQEDTVVISDAGGPTRLWRGIPAFRSILELISWEKGSHRSPRVACQGNE